VKDGPAECSDHPTAVTDAVEAANQVRPDQLVDLVTEASAKLGATATRMWLSDHGQRNLVHLTNSSRPRKPLPIDGSAAGRAYILSAEQERERPRGDHHLWLPLVDGVDRIGILEVEHPALTPALRRSYRRLASVAATETIIRGQYTDRFTVIRRKRPMDLAAELQWQMLPPTSFAAPEVSVAGLLEPAYHAAGDTFDYTYSAGALDFAIFDSVGHDLASALISTLAVGAYRNRRRSGDHLRTIGRVLDDVLADQMGHSAFATGILARLDTSSGVLSWCNGGHPPPLLVRQGRRVSELPGPRRVPFGLGHLVDAGRDRLAQAHLEPGDAVLLYTDGIVEARQANGEDFGLGRLEEFLAHAFAAQLPPAETLRRLSNAVLEHHGDTLQDDASTLLVIWHPSGPPA
jgi:hypothetical protein